MNILIDISHPAHVHYFKFIAKYFIKKNDIVLFVTRDKEVTIDLLKHYQFNYINIGKPFKSSFGKLFGLFWFTLRLGFIALKFKPDIYLNASFYSAFISRMFKKPHIVIADTFNKEGMSLIMPFTSNVITGDYPHPSLGKKEISVAAYQELLYLHPKYFNPDRNILKELAIKENEKYVIMRFVSWQVSHDRGHTGMSLENKIKVVKEFEKYAKVFITSEAELPYELKKYQLKTAPHKIHDVLAFSTILLGESATMASECAMLGVPSIFLDSTGRFYTKDLEKKYRMVFNYTESEEDQIAAIEKGVELLKMPNIKEEWQKRRERMLADKIDFTAFLVWFVENYPESFKIMKENPDYQYNFK